MKLCELMPCIVMEVPLVSFCRCSNVRLTCLVRTYRPSRKNPLAGPWECI